MATTDEWVTDVFDAWGEDQANSMVTPGQVTSWGNKAQRDLCLTGNILLQCAKGPFVEGQETYNLPSNYLKVDAVFLTATSGAPNWLRPMDVADRDPSEPKGVPDRYWIWGEDVNLVNAYIIGFAKIPTGFPVAPTNSWEAFYRKRPDTMVHSTVGAMVNPEVIPEFQDAMMDYALGMIYRRMSNTRPEFMSFFRLQMDLWKAHLEKAKNYINPMTFDYPVPRRDTALLTSQYDRW